MFPTVIFAAGFGTRMQELTIDILIANLCASVATAVKKSSFETRDKIESIRAGIAAQ